MTRSTIADERVAVTLLDAQPTPENLRAAVLEGLAVRPRVLPAKFFYDDAGARLFERITTLGEYYPTRTELGIMRRSMAASRGASVRGRRSSSSAAGAVSRHGFCSSTSRTPPPTCRSTSRASSWSGSRSM
jgi:hypothetical protein